MARKIDLHINGKGANMALSNNVDKKGLILATSTRSTTIILLLPLVISVATCYTLLPPIAGRHCCHVINTDCTSWRLSFNLQARREMTRISASLMPSTLRKSSAVLFFCAKTPEANSPFPALFNSNNISATSENKDLSKKSPQDYHTTIKYNNLREKLRLRMNKMVEWDESNDKKMLTQEFCDSLLGLSVAMNERDSVLTILEIMKKYHLDPQQHSTYRSCLEQCYETGNADSALETFNAMRNSALSPDSVDVQLVVLTYCRKNKYIPGCWKKGFDFLKSNASMDMMVKRKDTSIVSVEAFNSVLSCMEEESRWEESLELLHMMLDENAVSFHTPRPNLSTYHTVLNTCIMAGRGEEAVQLLSSMSSKGVKPSMYTFEIVVSSLLRKQQWSRAIQVLNLMNTTQITCQSASSTVIYNTVISACAKAGADRAALQLFVQMGKRHIKPDVITFNSLISACAGSGRWKDALSLLNQCMRAPGVEPDIITYTNAMRACARGGKTQKALDLLDVVKDKGIPLDTYAYTTIIDACAKGSMWRRALDLLDEMRKNGVVPNERTYSVAIVACGNGGQWERALELLNQMKMQRMKINEYIYNAAITAVAKASRNNLRKATNPYVATKSKKLDSGPPRSQVYGSIDKDQLWEKALNLLDQMRADGLNPDAYSFSAAISACGSGGRWHEALELLTIMKKGGPKTKPNIVAYTAAISACGRSGEWKHAVQLFDDMKAAGLQPDRVTYNALVSAFMVGGNGDMAYNVWKEMCGNLQSNSTNYNVASANSKVISPDIITVTEVIATLERSPGKHNLLRMDEVFAEAVNRGIVLSTNSMDTLWEIDLSGMSLPVARAACRFILKRILVNTGLNCNDLHLITGVGSAGRERSDLRKRGSVEVVLTMDESDVYNECGHSKKGLFGTTALREYVRQILRDDFVPPLYSSIPKSEAGTVLVKRELLSQWVESQI